MRSVGRKGKQSIREGRGTTGRVAAVKLVRLVGLVADEEGKEVMFCAEVLRTEMRKGRSSRGIREKSM